MNHRKSSETLVAPPADLHSRKQLIREQAHANCNAQLCKEDISRSIVESALRFMPDFRSHIVDTDTFTPRTITKFTSHLNGAVYGAPHKIRTGQTHLGNLFLCGTDQGFLGIVGSMLSGITVANLHLLKSP